MHIDTVLQDLRFALRALGKNPSFTIIVVAVLALGIGANTAIFSVVNSVLIRPLPYKDSDRLVELWGNVRRIVVERRGTSYPDFGDWRDQSRSFEGMAAISDATFTLLDVDEPERIRGEVMVGPYLSLLGVQAGLGRTFRPDEERGFTAPPVAVISYGFWARRFGTDRSIVGKTINLDSQKYTIVGVLPQGFRGITDSADIWVPASMLPGAAEDMKERGNRGFPVLAKLKPGVSIEQAQAEMDTIARALENAYPSTNEKRGVEVIRLDREIFGDVRPALLVILGAVGFVLLIGCANVANLLLGKSEARQREIAIRTALGASRMRLFRQLLTESLLLSFLGAGAGLVLAMGRDALLASSPIEFPSFVKARLDLTVLLFVLTISLIAGVALGLAPALHSVTGGIQDALKEASGKGSAGASRKGFRSALVVAEVAFALVLLIGAGLLIRSFHQLSILNPGFRPDHLLALRISIPRAAGDIQTATSARSIQDRIQSLPGVRAVSLGSDIPLSGEGGAIFFTAEGQPPVTAQNVPRAYVHRVTPGFFATLGIAMKWGRDFLPTDEDGPVVVSESVAKRFWLGQDPVGKRVKQGSANSKSPWMTIVGVVGEVNYRALPRNPTPDPDIYLPFRQRARGFALFLRTAVDSNSMIASVRSELHQLDRTITVYNVASMSERVGLQMALARFTTWIMGIFSAVALLMASIGIYGVISWSVTQRTREIGIRMALGAERNDVLGMVVRHGLGLILAGIAIGLGLSLVVTRLIRSLLFGVGSADPVTFGSVSILLILIAMLAIYVPARRATRVDPMVALRYE